MKIRTQDPIVKLLALSLLIFFTSSSQAAPLTLKSLLKSHSTALALSVTTTVDLSFCTVSIFGSRQKNDLLTTKAILVAAVKDQHRDFSFTIRNLSRLHIKSRKKTLPSYFAAVASCSGEDFASNITKINIPLHSTGLSSINAWLEAVKAKILVQSLTLTNAFPNLSFDTPVDLQTPKDGSGRVYIVEQSGKIYSIINASSTSTKELFIDLSNSIQYGGEQGLLALAFDPDYLHNGYFYLHYSKANGGNVVISRFTKNNADPPSADPSSEVILLDIDHPNSNHNGGTVAFGPDGYLYIATGDGGGAGDPDKNGQNLKSLFGKILRIDVHNSSGGKNYAIPLSNPFVGNQSGSLEEIFAYGLRNPWKMSFDQTSGTLWAGDVGQDKYEEIDIIQTGKNYGWNTMEGKHCYDPSTHCSRVGLTLPVFEYPHTVGEAITGGYLYRETAIPSLTGLYLYSDFETGTIWALDQKDGAYYNLKLESSGLNVSSFGVDENSELYVLSYGDGRIYTFSGH